MKLLLSLTLLSASAFADEAIYLTEQTGAMSSYSSYKKGAESTVIISFPNKTANKPSSIEMPEERTLIREIRQIALQEGIAPNLLIAIAETESAFRPNARSSKGAMGVMQLMPSTAAALGVKDNSSTTDNIRAGAKHIKNLLVRYHGNIGLALAAYNAGERRIGQSNLRIPPYKETMLYVPLVLARFSAMEAREGLQP